MQSKQKTDAISRVTLYTDDGKPVSVDEKVVRELLGSCHTGGESGISDQFRLGDASGGLSPILGGRAGVRVMNARSLPVKKGKKGKKGRLNEGVLVTHFVPSPKFPPSYNATPIQRTRRRFVSNENVAITNLTFNLATGHRQFTCVTVASTSGVSYADCWRIRKISVWTINYIDNATTATLIPVGADTSDNSFVDREAVFECTSRSEADPGHMSIKPALDTPLGSWHRTNNTNASGTLFILNVDYGGASSGNWATVTVDIEFDYVLNVYGAPQGYAPSTTSAVLGSLGGQNLTIGGSAALLLQGINVLG